MGAISRVKFGKMILIGYCGSTLMYMSPFCDEHLNKRYGEEVKCKGMKNFVVPDVHCKNHW